MKKGHIKTPKIKPEGPLQISRKLKKPIRPIKKINRKGRK
jgi:hypothetical protein